MTHNFTRHKVQGILHKNEDGTSSFVAKRMVICKIYFFKGHVHYYASLRVVANTFYTIKLSQRLPLDRIPQHQPLTGNSTPN